jgi:SRSO17 transposase
MRALLAELAWDWAAALAALQRFIVAHLGDAQAIVVLDETAELKKGQATVGVGRQHAGITGQVENCQTVVFAAYVTARGHTLSDFRLDLPKQWCGDKERRERAHVPEEVEFAAKPALGTAMITGVADAGVPFAWAAAGEVYGRGSKLREACEKNNKGYVPAVPVNFAVKLPSGRKATVAAVARLIPAAAWETRSCGPGCKGHRDYAWAWAATASPRHQVLIRRSLADRSDLAFFYTHAPEGRPVSLPTLVRVAGKRWPVSKKSKSTSRSRAVATWLNTCFSRARGGQREQHPLRRRVAAGPAPHRGHGLADTQPLPQLVQQVRPAEGDRPGIS